MTVSRFTVRNRWASVLAACIRTVHLHSVVSVVRYPNEGELQLGPTTGDRRLSIRDASATALTPAVRLITCVSVGMNDLSPSLAARRMKSWNLAGSRPGSGYQSGLRLR